MNSLGKVTMMTDSTVASRETETETVDKSGTRKRLADSIEMESANKKKREASSAGDATFNNIKKQNKKISRLQLEHLFSQRLCEITVNHKAEVEELRKQVDNFKGDIDLWKTRSECHSKQLKDLSTVMKKYIIDSKTRPESAEPMRITRTVGLQVNQAGIEKATRTGHVQPTISKATTPLHPGHVRPTSQVMTARPADALQPLQQPLAELPAQSVQRPLAELPAATNQPLQRTIVKLPDATAQSVQRPIVKLSAATAHSVQRPIVKLPATTAQSVQRSIVTLPATSAKPLQRSIVTLPVATAQPLQRSIVNLPATTAKPIKRHNAGVQSLQGAAATQPLQRPFESATPKQSLPPIPVYTLPRQSQLSNSNLQSHIQQQPAHKRAPEVVEIDLSDDDDPAPFRVSASQVNRTPILHPAPLPNAPAQLYIPTLILPPKPCLRLTKSKEGVVLSWGMTLNLLEHATIGSFELFAYQEVSSSVPDKSLWKKVGSVNALPLPMSCTLNKFLRGNRYHFAVRACDINKRLGEFSAPISVDI